MPLRVGRRAAPARHALAALLVCAWGVRHTACQLEPGECAAAAASVKAQADCTRRVAELESTLSALQARLSALEESVAKDDTSELATRVATLEQEAASFDREALEAHALVEAVCTAMMPVNSDGGGWAFAIRRECSSEAPDCTAVCAGATEGQAGALQCFNSVHVYSNQHAEGTAEVGLKTHVYGGCGGGCGPNWCCCTEASSAGKSLVARVGDLESSTAQLARNIDALSTDMDTFDHAELSAQVLVEAVCTSLNSGGWSFAMRRECSADAPDCATVCATATESQAGALQCYNSVHVYGNQPHDDANEVGLKTFIYGGCGGGCGPNYCCCKQK